MGTHENKKRNAQVRIKLSTMNREKKESSETT